GGAGHGVQVAGPRAIDEIGALAGVDDEPDFGAEGLPADRALEVVCLRVGMHGVSPGVGAFGWRRRRRLGGWIDYRADWGRLEIGDWRLGDWRLGVRG